MQLQIRSLRTWAVLGHPTALTWNLPAASATLTDTGTCTVEGDFSDYAGEWAYLSGHLYVIAKAAPKDGRSTLTLALPETAFARTLVYGGNGSEYWGDFIAARLASDFADQDDAAYAMPYLSVTNSDHSSFAMNVVKNDAYDFLALLQTASDAGVELRFSPSSTGLAVHVAPRSTVERQLYTSDNRTRLISYSATRSTVAKATVRQLARAKDSAGNETVTVKASRVYYWRADGTWDTTAPDPRIPGAWAIADVDEKHTLDEGAASAFANNTAGYKLELATTRTLSLGDRVTVNHRGRVISGIVTRLSYQNGDTRQRVLIGSLPTTLTEKVSASKTTTGGAAALYYSPDQIDALLNGLISTTTIQSGTVSVAANSASAWQDTSISRSGYTAVAVTDCYFTGSATCFLVGAFLNGSAVRWRATNTAASQASIVFHARVVWRKNN